MNIIYKNPDVSAEKTQHYRGDIHAFAPVFDSTDLFHWACTECGHIVDVLLVKRDDRYTQSPTIYFVLECKQCGNRGFRKICLEGHGKYFILMPTKIQFPKKTPQEAKAGIISEKKVKHDGKHVTRLHRVLR